MDATDGSPTVSRLARSVPTSLHSLFASISASSAAIGTPSNNSSSDESEDYSDMPDLEPVQPVLPVDPILPPRPRRSSRRSAEAPASDYAPGASAPSARSGGPPQFQFGPMRRSTASYRLDLEGDSSRMPLPFHFGAATDESSSARSFFRFGADEDSTMASFGQSARVARRRTTRPTTPPPPPRRSTRVAASAARETSRPTTAAARSATRPTAPRKRRNSSVSPPSSNKRTRASLKKPPPNAKNDADYEEDKTDADGKPEGASGQTCCICMCEPAKEDVSAINGCDHVFCFECIGKWADRENTCPLCKVRFSQIRRVHKSKKAKRGGKSMQNTKRVRQRDQRTDLVSGAALEAMLASFTAGSTHTRLGSFSFLISGGGPAARARGASFYNSHRSSDETEDGDDAFGPDIGFIVRNAVNETLRRSAAASRGPFAASIPAGGGFSFGAPPSMPPPTAARSYATNSSDRNAGRAAENPLEIDDSDDDSVEVVGIINHRSTTS